MNLAYKHLDSKLKIAELSLQQWAGVLVGMSIAIVWGFYISPFGSTATIVSAIYIGAVPAGAAMLASATEFDLWLVLRSAVAWRRAEGRYVRGPGDQAQGYALREDGRELELRERRREGIELDLETLWEGS